MDLRASYPNQSGFQYRGNTARPILVLECPAVPCGSGVTCTESLLPSSMTVRVNDARTFRLVSPQSVYEANGHLDGKLSYHENDTDGGEESGGEVRWQAVHECRLQDVIGESDESQDFLGYVPGRQAGRQAGGRASYLQTVKYNPYQFSVAHGPEGTDPASTNPDDERQPHRACMLQYAFRRDGFPEGKSEHTGFSVTPGGNEEEEEME
ncbi:hypothetical protein EYF80_021394 [Liparis tanakae]|uniref:Uncharacterized protein n=1 Tax=Liparis tanakae TaxID=230148 RepID=A0A4Z2HS18_9TELE|nr:hypothetical protein EYF80_021394 [Liparis tanakae]